jgi:hypothetical protein
MKADKLRALEAEANHVRDPGGPITDYSAVLYAWAATHPEVPANELRRITDKLIFDAR